jgi:hypothetical protein
MRPVATVDGGAVATWRARRARGRLAVDVERFAQIPPAAAFALNEEAADVARFEGLELR